MDDRIQQLERLAVLHRDGVLSDDEFRAEKLRVLAGGQADGIGRNGQANAVSTPEPAPVPTVSPAAALREPEPTPLQAGHDPDFGERFAEADARPRRAWLPIALIAAAVVAVIALVLWFIAEPVADAPRSSIGTADERAASADDGVLDMADTPLTQNTVEPEPAEETVATDVSDVTGALALTDPASCGFAPSADEAFDALLSRQGGEWTTDGPVQLGAVTMTPRLEVSQQTPTRPTGEEPADETAAAPQRPASVVYKSNARAPDGVTWNGLTFSRLLRTHVSRPDGGTVDRRGLTFLDEPAVVRRTLAGLGVDVPAGGRPIGGSCGGQMRLESIPGGSALVCERRCAG